MKEMNEMLEAHEKINSINTLILDDIFTLNNEDEENKRHSNSNLKINSS